MPFNLLLLPLLGGFFFFSRWDQSAFFAKRQDKERLLLYSSLWGVLFLAISFALSVLIPLSETLSDLRWWWAFHTPPIQYSGISSFALGLGLVLTGALNWFGRRTGTSDRVGERTILIYGSQLEKLLYRSLIEKKRVMVSLKSGKVYIGRVLEMITPESNKDFLLLPVKSGYRDDKQRLTITTSYDEAYKDIQDNEPEFIEIISDFGIVIPIPDVLSATLYREDVHAKYFGDEESVESSG
jgi:hypothetical protein